MIGLASNVSEAGGVDWRYAAGYPAKADVILLAVIQPL